jgi:type IV secretory pathway TrbF-like protein
MPYSAQQVQKIFTNPVGLSEVKRERWTAIVTHVLCESVKNNELAVNPLGLTIARFRVYQASSYG